MHIDISASSILKKTKINFIANDVNAINDREVNNFLLHKLIAPIDRGMPLPRRERIITKWHNLRLRFKLSGSAVVVYFHNGIIIITITIFGSTTIF